MVKKILIGILVVIVAIQFYRPERNLSGENANDFSNKYQVPEAVSNILSVACYDCHTNKTNYPWYAHIQPVGYWIGQHVEDGKQHLNLSTFLSRNIAYQNHKLEEIIEQVEEKEMPLPSYTNLGMHPEANLTDEQRQILMRWAKAQMDTLRAQYPPDRLLPSRWCAPSHY
jgi:hypothetical protein